MSINSKISSGTSLSDSWLNELMSKSDIVSVIGEYTTLTPKGGKLWGCCPFHNEKTPSFKVDETNQLYYCFGCHKGGNIITFLKEKENMTGYEAIRYLADRAGMQMPDTGYDKEAVKRRNSAMQRLYNANRDAARFFYTTLANSPDAINYFRNKRGFSDNIISKFGLGYAPDSWTSLCNHMKSLGYTDDELIGAGLAKRSEKGRLFDFFRNRVMFPIINDKGQVLAFGGRTMGNDKPKYINTGDTPIYNKRNNLFALNMLKKGTCNDIILTEGYIDVISLHSCGIENAVASLGTALTENQSKLLKRRTNTVYISYDGDSAGQEANIRGLDILAGEGLEVRVICLPDGYDPDDFARKFGKDEFMKLKDNSLSLNSFKLTHMTGKYNLNDPDDRQALAIEACKLICTLQPVEQERYYEQLSHITGITVPTLKAQGIRSSAANNPQPIHINSGYSRIKYTREKLPSFAADENQKAELLIIACCAISGKAAQYCENNAMEFITDESSKSFISAAAAASKNGEDFDIAAALNHLEDNTSKIAAAVSESIPYDDPVETVIDCVRRLKIAKCNSKLIQLSRLFDSHEINIDDYSIQYTELSKELKSLKSAGTEQNNS